MGDKRLRKEVMMQEGAQTIVRDAVKFCFSQIQSIEASNDDDSLIRLGFGCEMGKHRSVSVAITVAEEIMAKSSQDSMSVSVIVQHREIEQIPLNDVEHCDSYAGFRSSNRINRKKQKYSKKQSQEAERWNTS